MEKFLKLNIGDLVAWKHGQPADYLFGKDYGIITEVVTPEDCSFRHQYYYKIHWGIDNTASKWLEIFSPDQLELIAKGKR